MNAETGILELEIRDSSGAELWPEALEELEIAVTRVWDSEQIETEWKDGKARLDYGLYRLDVGGVDGFERSTLTVVIDRPLMPKRIGLTLGNLGDPFGSGCSGRPEILVRLDPAPNTDRDVWVRILPLNSDRPPQSARPNGEGIAEFCFATDRLYVLVVMEATGDEEDPIRVIAHQPIRPRWAYEQVIKLDAE